MMLRGLSVLGMLALWIVFSLHADPRLAPGPLAVFRVFLEEAATGAIAANLVATLTRVAASFSAAMALGALLGYAMGRSARVNALCEPWLLLLLNLPALVLTILAYIWLGLTDFAAIVAVALNKLPNTAVLLREGARAMDRDLDEMAQAFQIKAGRRLRHVTLPQLTPYLAAAVRSGLSLTWKIVLVVELLGRPNGVGFEIGTAFQTFDVARILAYAGAFIAVILLIEICLVQPLERHAARWR